MHLSELKGTYDAIFSLGNNCLPSIQLEKNNIRPYAGVLDWMDSQSLPHVNMLLKNRFEDFLDPHHLIPLGPSGDFLLVLDKKYEVTVVHDFPLIRNNAAHLSSYPEVKQKMHRRIQRFFDKLQTSRRILFVRVGGSFEETRELQSILSGMVKHDFHILLVNHQPGLVNVVENHWPLEKVCSLSLPWVADLLEGNNAHWMGIFTGIHYNSHAYRPTP
ncbi:DUF1796 family putative cysteine peptidase [Paenibacillus rigui]|uniref:Peptidase n=1 Tax=Paenibacillus rigui TaxID=554312 RepID=A0A229UTH2_9BACL|nr:DUF1796 family putative cysteine peptidase [Paenibacillus rigui]OXM86650.1 peptidase [Paenibacillus rigui]